MYCKLKTFSAGAGYCITLLPRNIEEEVHILMEYGNHLSEKCLSLVLYSLGEKYVTLKINIRILARDMICRAHTNMKITAYWKSNL